MSRNLPYQAAMARAFGLPADAALRAITLSPAEIFGVADRMGSIEVGKDANLVVATGDIMDHRTQVTHVFIDGVAAVPGDAAHAPVRAVQGAALIEQGGAGRIPNPRLHAGAIRRSGSPVLPRAAASPRDGRAPSPRAATRRRS